MNYDNFIREKLSDFEAEDKKYLSQGLSLLSECINDLHNPDVICQSGAEAYFDTVIKYSGFAGDRFSGGVSLACIALLMAFVKKEQGNLDLVRKAIQQGKYKDHEKQIIKNILDDSMEE